MARCPLREGDPLDRLSAARYDGVVVARYAYDLSGRRILKRVYGAGPYGAAVGFTRFVYRGGHVVAETDSAGSRTLGYTWGRGTDDLVGVGGQGRRSADGLSLKRPRVAASAAVLPAEPRLEPRTCPFALRYRWTGREYDRELGWYWFRSRSYDPAIGRFVQEDAIGWAGGPNLYAYGDGNPTNGRDPDGLSKDARAFPQPRPYTEEC